MRIAFGDTAVMASKDWRGLGDVLGGVLATLGESGSSASLQPVWARCVGEPIASHTQVASLTRGVLTVRCDGEPWKAALEGQLGPTLTKLNALLGAGTIRSIGVVA